MSGDCAMQRETAERAALTPVRRHGQEKLVSRFRAYFFRGSGGNCKMLKPSPVK